MKSQFALVMELDPATGALIEQHFFDTTHEAQVYLAYRITYRRFVDQDEGRMIEVHNDKAPADHPRFLLFPVPVSERLLYIIDFLYHNSFCTTGRNLCEDAGFDLAKAWHATEPHNREYLIFLILTNFCRLLTERDVDLLITSFQVDEDLSKEYWYNNRHHRWTPFAHDYGIAAEYSLFEVWVKLQPYLLPEGTRR